MEVLTYLCLPLAVAYVAWPERFTNPWTFGLAGFALLPDADKIVGLQGIFHTVPFVVVSAAVLIGGERVLRGRVRYASIAVALLASHLVLDLLDGGPIFILAPGVTSGIELTFPTTIAFGGSPM